MAGDGKAEDDASAPPAAGSGGPALSLQGASAPPREKPLIEGEAIKAETREPQTKRAEIQKLAVGTSKESSQNAPPDVAGAAPDSEAAASAGAPEAAARAEDAEPSAMESAAPASALKLVPARRGNPWPLAVAIVIGALIAVGGAFGLHSLDTTPKSLAALESRVAALEHGQATTQALQADTAALGTRIGALESGMRKTAATLAGLQQSVQQLGVAQQQEAQKAAAASPALGPAAVDLAPLSARVGKLEDGLASLDQRLGDLASKFEGLTRAALAAKDRAARAATARAETDAVAIIAASLRRKVDAGAAFTDDLSALANRGVDRAKLAPLQAFAASGVATPAALAKQFSALAADIIATEPEPKAEGFFGRLAQDAGHLVRIRKIGAPTGDDLAAHVARIRAALNSGAVAEALNEWNDLPAAAKAKSQAFGVAAQRRLAAVSAATSIEADALAALAKVKS